jgi:hypothetical protein
MCNSKDSFLETENRNERLVSWEKYYEMYKDGHTIDSVHVNQEILAKFEPTERSASRHERLILEDIEINSIKSGTWITGSQDEMDISMWLDELWGADAINRVKFFEPQPNPFRNNDHRPPNYKPTAVANPFRHVDIALNPFLPSDPGK